MALNIGFDAESPPLDDLVGALSSQLVTALRMVDNIRTSAVNSTPIAAASYFEAHNRIVSALTDINTHSATIGAPFATAWAAKFAQEDLDLGTDYAEVQAACVALIDAIWSIMPKDGDGRILLWQPRDANTRQVASQMITLDAGGQAAFDALWAAIRAVIR